MRLVTIRPILATVVFLAEHDGGWRMIRDEAVAIPELGLFGLDADGELIVGARPAETGRFGLYVMSGEDGSLAGPYVPRQAPEGVTAAR